MYPAKADGLRHRRIESIGFTSYPHLFQTHKRLKRMLIYYDTDTRSAIFLGNWQATKRHLVKNDDKRNNLFLLFPCPVLGRKFTLLVVSH